MAFVRIGRFKAQGDKIDELCRIYEQEAIPTIRAAQGNISAALLQQEGAADAFLAITVWQNRDDAELYDCSGQAQEMVGKIRHAFAGPPVLETYAAYGI
jgi:quinol monooxygenase YgiN